MWTRAELPFFIYSVFTEAFSNIHIRTAGEIQLYVVNLPLNCFTYIPK